MSPFRTWKFLILYPMQNPRFLPQKKPHKQSTRPLPLLFTIDYSNFRFPQRILCVWMLSYLLCFKLCTHCMYQFLCFAFTTDFEYVVVWHFSGIYIINLCYRKIRDHEHGSKRKFDPFKPSSSSPERQRPRHWWWKLPILVDLFFHIIFIFSKSLL